MILGELSLQGTWTLFYSIFLQALLLVQTEQLYHLVLCLTKHVFLKVWVNMEDSPAPIVHTKTQFLDTAVHIIQKIMSYQCKQFITDIFCLTIDTIFLYP
jgi:hypothetical protein